jgi:hypothetical protein
MQKNIPAENMRVNWYHVNWGTKYKMVAGRTSVTNARREHRQPGYAVREPIVNKTPKRMLG